MGRRLFRSSSPGLFPDSAPTMPQQGSAADVVQTGRIAEDLSDLIVAARHMSASRFILAVTARGHDPVRALNALTSEALGL